MSWWVWLLYFGVYVAFVILITVLLRRSSPGRLVHREGVQTGSASRGETVTAAPDEVNAEAIATPAAESGTHVATAPAGTPPSRWAPAPGKASVPAPPATPEQPAAAYVAPAPADDSGADTATASVADTAASARRELATAAASPVRSGNVIVRGLYGDDSAAPLPDGSAPSGYSIKGNASSMRYHTKDSPSYDDTKATVFFRSEGVALFAGFSPWNWRSSSDAPGAGLPGQRVTGQPPAEAETPEPVAAAETETETETGRAGPTLTVTRPTTVAPYGKDSAAPRADGSAPDGFTIKGNAGSMLFHTEDSPYYGRTKAQAWFRTEEAAAAAGFRPWNWRKRR